MFCGSLYAAERDPFNDAADNRNNHSDYSKKYCHQQEESNYSEEPIRSPASLYSDISQQRHDWLTYQRYYHGNQDIYKDVAEIPAYCSN